MVQCIACFKVRTWAADILCCVALGDSEMSASTLLRAFYVLFLSSLLCVVSGLLPAGAGMEDLRINEFMADNRCTLYDEDGEPADWLELYNSGSTPVNLEGLFLTDDPSNTQKWAFPDTVMPPGAFFIIWCDTETDEGPLHTNFNLDADGEFVGLYEYLGAGNDPIDTTSFGHQAADISFGRYPDGTGPYGYLAHPTPGWLNSGYGTIPPWFEQTHHEPGIPEPDEPVTVLARIFDDSGLDATRLYFDAGSGFEWTDMLDDGAHGDGEPGDGLYGAIIGGFLDQTQVAYYVWARDDSLMEATDPEGAPAAAYYFQVGYELPALFVNEFLASNDSVLADEYGEYDDWVEIYNGTDEEISLAGLHLTDSPTEPDRFTFPDTTIGPRGFLLVWCDNDPEQGPLHTGFKLRASGEFIGLYESQMHGMVPIDTLSFGQQTTDVSYGRLPDGGPEWVFFDDPTPGAPNGAQGADEPGAGGLIVDVLGNPTGDILRLGLRMAGDGPIRVEVLDAEGRRVVRFESPIAPYGAGLSVPLRTLSPGLYWVRVDAGGLVGAARIAVVR